MKIKNIIVTLFLGILSATASFAQTEKQGKQRQEQQVIKVKTEEFKVYGKCGMCKRRIESALKDIKGIQAATWDVDSKMLKVSYDENLISLHEINQKIADVGHDTEYKKAKDEQYAQLPGCCRYDRARG